MKMKNATKLRKPKAEQEGNVVEQQKASLEPKKMGSEVDEIFAAKKRKRLENEKKGDDEKPAKVVKQEEKASLKPKKMGSEIDDIFAAKKRKRLENEKKVDDEKAAKAVAASARRLKKKEGKSSKNHNSFVNHISQQKKKTSDGLTIFTEEELGIGNPDAGGTALCPFDCNCCF